MARRQTFRRRQNPLFFDIHEILNLELRGEIGARTRRLQKDMAKFNGDNGIIRRTNQKSLDWIKPRAVKNLQNSKRAHRNHRDTGRDGLLEEVIQSDLAHSNTQTGFRFMVVSNVDKLMNAGGKGKNNKYAFAIEFGSSYWVGKKLPFAFLGRDNPVRAGRGKRAAETHDKRTYNRNAPLDNRGFYRPNAARGTSSGGVHRFDTGRDTRIVSDRIVGPREYKTLGKPKGYKRFLVTINRPVPAYAYGRKATAAFEEANVYGKEIYARTREFQKTTGIKVNVRGYPALT